MDIVLFPQKKPQTNHQQNKQPPKKTQTKKNPEEQTTKPIQNPQQQKNKTKHNIFIEITKFTLMDLTFSERSCCTVYLWMI